MLTFNIKDYIKKTHTECIETWKSILQKSELEIISLFRFELIEENAYNFF